MRPDAIPLELRVIPQWVGWSPEMRKGKQTKVPRIARRPRALASVSDSRTWGPFEIALRAACENSDLLDGIGFVLTPDDPFVGIDIDECIHADGNIASEVAELVRALDSYTEISPSGTGLRVFIRARFIHPLTGTHGGHARFPGCKKIEVYFAERFLTVTGNRFRGTPELIGERQDALDKLVSTLWPATAPRDSTMAAAPSLTSASASLSDDELLDQARNAKDGEKFSALFDHGDISAYDHDESRADAALCCLLAFWTGGDKERIEQMFNRSALVRDKWTDRPDYRERTIRGAIAKVTHKRDQEARARLPQVLIETNIQNVADQAEAALRERAPGLIYQRSDVLVHVTRDAPPKKESKILTRTPQAPRIVIMEPARLRELLSTTARFAERKGGQGTSQPRFKSVLPPKWLVETLLARQQWDLPQLDGIVEAPCLRPDGTILDVPGFDEATGTLYVPQHGLVLPPFLDEPSIDDARRAIDQLLDPLQDFRFVTDADRSTALAAILTGLARMAIRGPTPLFALGAPIRGAGKTLLGNIITMIVTGHEAAVFSPPRDADALSKVLFAVALGGDPVVLMDNIEGTFGSAPLAGALTSCFIGDRVLGISRFVRAALRPLWLATGNNIQWVGDLARRVASCDQDPQMENPEDRVGFKYRDLLAHVRATRGQLVHAGLTVLRAHAVAGMPAHGGARMGSFEAWDDRVRAPLIWAGQADPLKTRERVRSHADSDVALLREVHEAWWHAFNECGGTVAQAIHMAAGDDEDALVLRNALAQLDPRGGGKSFNPQTIGTRIVSLARRIVDGRRFERAGEARGSARWKVVRVGDGHAE